ncbi:MAG: uroporphyrinogen-III C-methyltransferase [Thermomicrobiales bacterium]
MTMTRDEHRPTTTVAASDQASDASLLTLFDELSRQPDVPPVALIGAGPGDPGLLTLRGLARLRTAEVVVYDRLLDPRLLESAPQAAERIAVGKRRGHHTLRQEAINELLVARGRAGQRVVRLKGGDPFVFGRGGEEAEALARAGVPFEVVPGVTSAVAVPAYAGIPVTQRGVASSFTVMTGHGEPDSAALVDEWAASGLTGTLVLLMGVSMLPCLAARLIARGRSAETPAAAIEWGTWPQQRVITGTLATLPDLARAANLTSPATIVVGEVVALREHIQWFGRVTRDEGAEVGAGPGAWPQRRRAHRPASR